MRPRKHERDQLTELLDRDWEDVDELTTAVFALVAQHLLDRDWWVLAAAHDGQLTIAGPYGTRRKATLAAPDLQFLAADTRVIVRRLVNTNDMTDDDYA